MRPTFHHEMATARVADLHHYAARERTAKAAIRARRAQPRPAPGSCPVIPSPASRAGRSHWPAAAARRRHGDHPASPRRPQAVDPGQAPAATVPPPVRNMPVSATLAANEAMAARRGRGLPVLPLAFGEAGLAGAPGAARRAGRGRRGQRVRPGGRAAALRSAAAGYWARRGLPTSPGQVVCGPGSKPLLFGLLLALGGDVALPRPSWVSYAAQAAMIGTRPHFVPAPPGEGGIPDPDALAAAATAAAAAGPPIRSVVVTLPDNPTGRAGRARPRSPRSARWPPRTGWSSSATRSTATWCTTRPPRS